MLTHIFIKIHLNSTYTCPLILFILFNLINYQNGIAQDFRVSDAVSLEKIENLLIQEGFQSVGAKFNSNKLIVTYENRRYRLEALAIEKIATLIQSENLQDIDTLILVTQKFNIPIISTTYLLSSDSASFLHTQQKIAPTEKNFKNQLKNKGNYRLELEVKPQLRLALGGFPDPVVHQINLIPQLHFYLWKGARFSFQTIIPISNEFETPTEKYVRPGIVQLEQRFRLPAQTYIGLTAGYFTKNRYGGLAEVGKYFFNGNLLLRAQAGYTGLAVYEKEPDKVWKISRPDYLDYQFGADYYFKKWNVIASVDYAKTLFGQTMLRGSVLKYFKEVNIGFFAFKTERGLNYGLNCAIPLFPKKYFKPGFFSIRPSRALDYTYHGTQNYVTQYRSIQDLKIFMQRLEPFFINQQIK